MMQQTLGLMMNRPLESGDFTYDPDDDFSALSEAFTDTGPGTAHHVKKPQAKAKRKNQRAARKRNR